MARFARELKLGDLILLGTGERNNGGNNRDSVLANVFESMIGAISCDGDEKQVERMLHKTIYQHIDDVNREDITDFKTTLQELIQSDQRKTVVYRLLSTSGPANAPIFEVVVTMDDMVLGKGKGSSKKRAEQQAAKDALEKLAKNNT